MYHRSRRAGQRGQEICWLGLSGLWELNGDRTVCQWISGFSAIGVLVDKVLSVSHKFLTDSHTPGSDSDSH